MMNCQPNLVLTVKNTTQVAPSNSKGWLGFDGFQVASNSSSLFGLNGTFCAQLQLQSCFLRLLLFTHSRLALGNS